ncbi:hypothetical protein [Roseibacillus ishigakijimensis]|uniref:Uncharacterized protein n=1 Tax=Roseibacillus ishigakijimensis TaxID=454146 RepID=A0A934RRJ8_9BACT|nr:hypothetical protein [Roseibacillus ishigakijimensis]MBK1832950.1 hypothetical protein [Roseibacillus ishigakijimensis]
MKNWTLFRSLASAGACLAAGALASCTPYPPQAPLAYGGPRISPPSDYRSAELGNEGSDYREAGSGGSSYQPPSRLNNNSSASQSRPGYQPPAPSPATSENRPAQTSSGEIPVAMSSLKPNTVISPYPPYNVLDTTGASSGDKLCDPSTIPIDPATGKPYVDPATGLPDVKRGKYFIVP